MVLSVCLNVRTYCRSIVSVIPEEGLGWGEVKTTHQYIHETYHMSGPNHIYIHTGILHHTFQ